LTLATESVYYSWFFRSLHESARLLARIGAIMSDYSRMKCKTLNGKAATTAFILGFFPELSFAHNGHCPAPGVTILPLPLTYTVNFVPPPKTPPTQCEGRQTVIRANSTCLFASKETTFCDTVPFVTSIFFGNYVSSVRTIKVNGQTVLEQTCTLTGGGVVGPTTVYPCHTTP
jgi:hypothetical protein